jgi:hypothetical protein
VRNSLWLLQVTVSNASGFHAKRKFNGQSVKVASMPGRIAHYVGRTFRLGKHTSMITSAIKGPSEFAPKGIFINGISLSMFLTPDVEPG